MILDDSFSPNDLFYLPCTLFWGDTDKDSVYAHSHAAEWSKVVNVFISRMALGFEPGSHKSNLSQSDFSQLIQALVTLHPEKTIHFLVLPLNQHGTVLNVMLKTIYDGQSPPLLADNACALPLALEWAGKLNKPIELSCSAGPSFWVHSH